jgi:hypothetical protein
MLHPFLSVHERTIYLDIVGRALRARRRLPRNAFGFAYRFRTNSWKFVKCASKSSLIRVHRCSYLVKIFFVWFVPAKSKRDKPSLGHARRFVGRRKRAVPTINQRDDLPGRRDFQVIGIVNLA